MAGNGIIVYGFGNPGREDDGLGVALARRIEAERIPGVSVDTDYQLTVEVALEIARHDTVIFVDASKREIESYGFREIEPEFHSSFTSHALSPGSVLALCRELFNKHPRAFVLEIKGFSWEMREGISAEGEKNLTVAFAFLKTILTGVTPVAAARRAAA